MRAKETATIHDVARESGFSISTVSHVLNDTRHVDEETRQKVLKAIRKLSYTPNILAQGLKGKGTKTIGVVISDIREDFFSCIVKAIESKANERGYAVILCDSEEVVEKEALSLEMLLRKGVDGILFAPVDAGVVPRVLARREVPLVQIDRKCAALKADYVGIDNASAAYSLTRHMLAHGHTKLGFVGHEFSIYTMEMRMEGFRRALAEAGAGAAASEMLLGSRDKPQIEDIAAWLEEEKNLQGIVCHNANMLIDVLAAVEALGLSVPGDVALASFDDPPWYRFLKSPVTAIRQPTERLGSEAAALLFDRIEGRREGPGQDLILESELIIRGSCGTHHDQAPVVDRSYSQRNRFETR